ncbi:uncharacterized protein TM35_000191110 [Trypanosoma theileri]|uniref:BAG domain-containing protein n=1 Tax=Trypanosoma theileri TaxID=67003 RepID=A0A1X0NT32_9TRYP|nr:uncharacterized protein TM35_000191110 [Trypanosoma theileri]ORC87867.1 hypothetical protein TM35_000191110 [Trypanosoma theileri]
MYSGDMFGGTQVRVQIRSVRGETVDLAVPSGCTVGQLRNFLIQEYDYPPTTRLMYNTSVVGDDSYVEEFPYGSLVIVTPADSRHMNYETRPQASLSSYGAQRQQQQQQRQQQQQQQQQRQQQQQQQFAHQESQRLARNQQPQQQQQRPTQSTRLPQHQFSQPQQQQQQQQQQRQNYRDNRPQDLYHQQQQRQTVQQHTQPSDGNSQLRQQGQQRDHQQLFTESQKTATAMSTYATSSRMQNSRTRSNSRHSSGLRTPRSARGKEQQTRSNEPVKSIPRQSSPPMRSPYRSTDTTLNNSVTSPGSAALHPTQNNSGEGEAQKAEKSRATSSVPTPLHPSRTPRDENNESTNNDLNVNSNISGVDVDDAGENNTTPPDQASEPTRGPLIPLKCIIPALDKSIILELPEDATIGDLLLLAVAQEPRLAGSKIVFRGKVLSGSDVRLSSCGIRNGGPPLSVITLNPNAEGVYTLFFACGEYSNTNKVMLVEIETDVSNIVSSIQDHEHQQKELPLQLRRGYYEELMRILFRTDNLQDLDDDWRLRRKDVVKKVTHIQDELNVANDA